MVHDLFSGKSKEPTLHCHLAACRLNARSRNFLLAGTLQEEDNKAKRKIGLAKWCSSVYSCHGDLRVAGRSPCHLGNYVCCSYSSATQSRLLPVHSTMQNLKYYKEHLNNDINGRNVSLTSWTVLKLAGVACWENIDPGWWRAIYT